MPDSGSFLHWLKQNSKPMSRRTTAVAAALSVLALGSPLITGCTNPLGIHYFNQGVEKYKAGNYQGAIDDYTKSIEMNSQNTDAYYNRGNVSFSLEDYQAAIVDYTKAVHVDPEKVSAIVNRGIAKEMVGDLEGACIDWKEASSMGREDAAGWVKNQC